MRKHLFNWTLVGVVAAAPLMAASSRIFVLNNGSSTIQVIDGKSNKIVQTIEGIPNSHGIAFSSDKKTAYLTSETENTLYAVDIKSGKIVNKLKHTPGSANIPAITNDGKRLFVCVNGLRDEKGNMRSDLGGYIDIVDLTTFKVKKNFHMTGGMHDCYMTPDGKYALGGSLGGKLLVAIDTKAEEIAWQMNFDKGVTTISMETAPDGSTKRLLVPLNQMRGFAVIDFPTHKEINRITLPEVPAGFLLDGKLERRNVTATHGANIAPDGKSFWVASRNANAVFAYSLPELKLLGSVSTPTAKGKAHPYDSGDPGWLCFSHDSKTVYVANAADNSVSVINAKTFKQVAVIPVGEQPDHVETLVLP
jgi:YVTN family beta-propeller protein